jgi:1-aminocyclopropane-1-carboxylate deaminase/D-cysteine desulfhydrase-like pyridoxal-dependent ACC family enzyme
MVLSNMRLVGFAKMLYTVIRSHISRDVYFQYPGGATPLGAMGHMSAGLELAESIEAGECPDPTHLFIAYGSGCSTAGLIVGMAIARKLRRGFRRPLNEFTLHRYFC